MVKVYPSEKAAREYGAYYAGYETVGGIERALKIASIRTVRETQREYTLPNPTGKQVIFTTKKVKTGYTLSMQDPRTGIRLKL